MVRPRESKLEEHPTAESGPGFDAVFAAELEVIAERRKVVGLDTHALEAATSAFERRAEARSGAGLDRALLVGRRDPLGELQPRCPPGLSSTPS